MFFKHVVNLWLPSELETQLDIGQHTWSFSFNLPINLPPTLYFEDWCSTFYQARGFIDPGSSNLLKDTLCSEKIIFDVYGTNERFVSSIIVSIELYNV